MTTSGDSVSSKTNSWISKYGHVGKETNELISGKTKIEDLQLVCINLLEKQLDLAWDSSSWASRTRSSFFKYLVELSTQKKSDQNIKVRMITEITKESMTPIKALRPVFDIRHLGDLKGNFEIFDSRQYFVYLPSATDDNSEQLLYSSVKTFVEQQQRIFNSLWKRAIPAEHRISEIERGSSPEFVEVVRDLTEITEIAKELIETSTLEIQIIATDIRTLLLILTPALLQELIRGALKRGIEIRVLFEDRSTARAKKAESLMNNIILNHAQDITTTLALIAVRYTSKSSGMNQVRIVKDNRFSFVIEITGGSFELSSEDQTRPIVVATYTNNASSVWANVSIFETMWNNSTHSRASRGEKIRRLQASKPSTNESTLE